MGEGESLTDDDRTIWLSELVMVGEGKVENDVDDDREGPSEIVTDLVCVMLSEDVDISESVVDGDADKVCTRLSVSETVGRALLLWEREAVDERVDADAVLDKPLCEVESVLSLLSLSETAEENDFEIVVV